MANPRHHPLVYHLALLIFYVKILTLTPIAYLFNKSYLLSHPNRPLPFVLTPYWNHTIHSLYVTPDIHRYLLRQIPSIPRASLLPFQMDTYIPTQHTLHDALQVRGNLQGPRLQQGMIICYQGRTLYLAEPLIVIPNNPALVTTNSITLDTEQTFPLILPRRHINHIYLPTNSLSPHLQRVVQTLRLTQQSLRNAETV